MIGRETITVFLHRISALNLERLEAFLVSKKAGFIITKSSHSWLEQEELGLNYVKNYHKLRLG